MRPAGANRRGVAQQRQARPGGVGLQHLQVAHNLAVAHGAHQRQIVNRELGRAIGLVHLPALEHQRDRHASGSGPEQLAAVAARGLHPQVGVGDGDALGHVVEQRVEQALGLLQTRLGLFARGHVQHQRKDGAKLPGLVDERRVVPLAVDHRAILAVVAIGRKTAALARDQPGVGLGDAAGVLLVQPPHLLGPPAQHLLRSPAEETLGFERPARDAQVRPPLDHRQRRVVHVVGQALRQLAHLLFAAFALGHVADHGQHHQLAAIAKDARVHFRGDAPSVARQQRLLVPQHALA
jgi:hypothetical protein